MAGRRRGLSAKSISISDFELNFTLQSLDQNHGANACLYPGAKLLCPVCGAGIIGRMEKFR